MNENDQNHGNADTPANNDQPFGAVPPPPREHQVVGEYDDVTRRRDQAQIDPAQTTVPASPYQANNPATSHMNPVPLPPAPQQPPGHNDYQQVYQAPAAGQPATRRALGVGAWIGIGAGAVAIISMGLVAALVVAPTIASISAVAEQDTADDDSPDDSATDPTETARPDATTAPSTDPVTLDGSLTYSNGPFWMTPFGDGWDIEVFDQQGYNRFAHAESGCKFLTFQGAGNPAETSTSDRSATDNIVDIALTIGLPWDSTASPVVERQGTKELTFNSTTPVEFLQLKATYPTSAGDRERSMLLRTFMPGNNVLYAEVDCPAGTTGIADEVWSGLGLTEY